MLALRGTAPRCVHRARPVAPAVARQRALSNGTSATRLSDIKRGPGAPSCSLALLLTPTEREKLALKVGDVLHGFRVTQVNAHFFLSFLNQAGYGREGTKPEVLPSITRRNESRAPTC